MTDDRFKAGDFTRSHHEDTNRVSKVIFQAILLPTVQADASLY